MPAPAPRAAAGSSGVQPMRDSSASSDDKANWHGTTIVCVRKGGQVVIAGDGQVSMGQTIVKGNARKVRQLGRAR